MAHADHLLRIYLNDHEAGQVVGRELARRSLSNNRGTEFGQFLQAFLDDLDGDAGVLRDAMAALGLSSDRVKQVAAWTVEKLGRLKLNGRVVGYSPLSRLEELEGLLLGVEGKLALWATLAEVVRRDDRLAGFDFTERERRAREQRRRLERLRRLAARRAFGGDRADVNRPSPPAET